MSTQPNTGKYKQEYTGWARLFRVYANIISMDSRYMRTRELAITCDDCGLSEGINLATADLYSKGIATAASIMTNFPAAQHAIKVFARCPSLDIGVHLNLTDGFPLTELQDESGLADPNGRFRPRSTLFRNALIARNDFLWSVETELAAQIDVLINAGVQPRHLTTHIHFHSFASLRNIVYKLARRFGIIWVRNGSIRKAVIPFNPLLSTRIDDRSPAAGDVLTPDFLVGLQYWMRFSSPERLLSKLLTLWGKIELVVHPCRQHDNTYPQEVHYQPEERFNEMRYFEEFSQLLHREAADSFRFTAI